MLYATIHTELLLINFWFALALGSVIGSLGKTGGKVFAAYKISPAGFRFLKYLAYTSALMSAVVASRYWFYKVNYHQELTRAQLYSSVGSDGIFFSAIYVACMYLKGIGTVLLEFILLRSLLKQDRVIILICIAILSFDALVFSAKGPVIHIGFIFLLYALLISTKNLNLLKYLIIGATFVAVALWYMNFRRGENIVESFIRYFSIGPSLLSNLVGGGLGGGYHGWSPSNISLLFSGFDYLVVIFFRAITSMPIQSSGYDWIKYIDIPQAIATSAYHFFPSNTFYTILSEPYLAFGLVGVITIGLLLGWLITVFERSYTLYGCEKDLFWLQYFMGIGFFGIFVSPFSGVIFWLILGLMLFFSSYIFKKFVA